MITSKILNPTLDFANLSGASIFSKFLSYNKIKHEQNLVKIILDGAFAPREITVLFDDFESWGKEFHEDLLKESFLKLASICGTFRGTYQELKEKIKLFMEVSEQDFEMFDIVNEFFTFTIYKTNYLGEEKNKFVLSGNVECFSFNDRIGNAICEFNDQGEFECTFTKVD